MKVFLKKMKPIIPIGLWNFFKKVYLLSSVFKVLGRPKVFCISMQRNGTTSVGQFLKDHGFAVASYGQHSKDWSTLWEKGDYDRIFRSLKFRSFQAYEDNPWWFPDFYRVLHQKFPEAKFILLTRDSNKWFESINNHKSIRGLSNTYRHNKIYNKLDIYYEKIDSIQNSNFSNVPEIPFEEAKERYVMTYNIYNREVVEYFKKYAPNKLFTTKLEDKNKWVDIGEFLGIKVSENYDAHANKSKNYF
jgi:hypothetical protein